MQRRKSVAVIVACIVAVLAVALLAGCGSSSSSTSASPVASASPTTPTEAMTQILGHAPTGMAAAIAQKGSFTVVDDANYPPQSYVDKQGNLIGFDVDVAKRLSAILGIPANIKNAPWDAVIAGIPVGRFDVSIGSMTITAERLKSMDFSEPYYFTQAQVIVKQGSPVLADAAALKGTTIGVGTGTTYYDFLTKLGGVKVKTYPTDADTFPDLKNGRLDAAMTADFTAAQSISSGFPFVFAGKPYYYEPLAFSIQKGQADWLALLDYAVKKMHADGSLTAMSKKWYHGFDTTKAPASGVPSYEQAYAALP
jgi:polar amino acid transport system substrate-binding protein